MNRFTVHASRSFVAALLLVACQLANAQNGPVTIEPGKFLGGGCLQRKDYPTLPILAAQQDVWSTCLGASLQWVQASSSGTCKKPFGVQKGDKLHIRYTANGLEFAIVGPKGVVVGPLPAKFGPPVPGTGAEPAAPMWLRGDSGDYSFFVYLIDVAGPNGTRGKVFWLEVFDRSEPACKAEMPTDSNVVFAQCPSPKGPISVGELLSAEGIWLSARQTEVGPGPELKSPNGVCEPFPVAKSTSQSEIELAVSMETPPSERAQLFKAQQAGQYMVRGQRPVQATGKPIHFHTSTPVKLTSIGGDPACPGAPLFRDATMAVVGAPWTGKPLLELTLNPEDTAPVKQTLALEAVQADGVVWMQTTTPDQFQRRYAVYLRDCKEDLSAPTALGKMYVIEAFDRCSASHSPQLGQSVLPRVNAHSCFADGVDRDLRARQTEVGVGPELR